MNQYVLIGAGAHARVLVEAVRLSGCPDPVAAVDSNPDLWGKKMDGIEIVGDDSKLPLLAGSGVQDFVIGIGSTSTTSARRGLVKRAMDLGLTPLTVVHPLAVISPSAKIESGCQILAGAIVGAGVVLGQCCLLNTRSVVEHDCRLGRFCHVASGAVLAGGVVLRDGVHIGAGAVVRQHVLIGDRAVVGIGAAVVKDIPRDNIVAGVPARFLKYVGDL